MSFAMWTCLLIALVPGQEPEVAPVVATTARVTSTLQPEVASSSVGVRAVDVGAHLTWRVTVDDPERDGAILAEPALGPEWAVLDGPNEHLDPGAPKASRPDVDRSWTIMPLAGGTAVTPALTVTFGDGATAEIPSATIEVAPSLGETEETPRPLLGFREAPDRRVGDPRAAMIALGALLAGIVVLVLWRRSVKRRAAAPAPVAVEPSALEQIRGLEKAAETGGAPAASMAALGPLFRRAFDAELAPAERLRRAALTDMAWADEVEGTPGRGPDAARLIAELSAYRYGGGEPTSFAVKDAIQRALTLAGGVAASGAAAGSPEEAA